MHHIEPPKTPSSTINTRLYTDKSGKKIWFLNWRQARFQRDGPSAEAMRFSRARSQHE